MIHKVFSVYDSKAEAYLPPFFLPSRGQALRVFADCASDPKHQFGRHPADYTLFEVGEFDDSSGLFVGPESGHINLGVALEFASQASSSVAHLHQLDKKGA